ncbi:hypothetical protein TL16_g00667 [Triparma laevis f. inornata]|uniref:Uncharacterized protein n=2 Tax=Triparma laevis TaxID=1534972 RepID=A0A9W7FTY5_9STRA|nr:hypothetical protein TL16_g00667 [Triparma laevis f. inornata]GMI18194.1 hypothetical protein TrLO_g968 [Triparma laevis f. longispina]
MHRLSHLSVSVHDTAQIWTYKTSTKHSPTSSSSPELLKLASREIGSAYDHYNVKYTVNNSPPVNLSGRNEFKESSVFIDVQEEMLEIRGRASLKKFPGEGLEFYVKNRENFIGGNVCWYLNFLSTFSPAIRSEIKKSLPFKLLIQDLRHTLNREGFTWLNTWHISQIAQSFGKLGGGDGAFFLEAVDSAAENYVFCSEVEDIAKVAWAFSRMQRPVGEGRFFTAIDEDCGRILNEGKVYELADICVGFGKQTHSNWAKEREQRRKALDFQDVVEKESDPNPTQTQPQTNLLNEPARNHKGDFLRSLVRRNLPRCLEEENTRASATIPKILWAVSRQSDIQVKRNILEQLVDSDSDTPCPYIELMYSHRDHWSFAQNAGLFIEALGDSNKSIQDKQRRLLKQLLLGPPGSEDKERPKKLFEALADPRLHFNKHPLTIKAIMLSLEKAGMERHVPKKYKAKAIRHSWKSYRRGKESKATKEFDKKQGQMIDEIRNNRGLARTEKIQLLHSIYEESHNQAYMSANNVAKIMCAATKAATIRPPHEIGSPNPNAYKNDKRFELLLYDLKLQIKHTGTGIDAFHPHNTVNMLKAFANFAKARAGLPQCDFLTDAITSTNKKIVDKACKRNAAEAWLYFGLISAYMVACHDMWVSTMDMNIEVARRGEEVCKVWANHHRLERAKRRQDKTRREKRQFGDYR